MKKILIILIFIAILELLVTGCSKKVKINENNDEIKILSLSDKDQLIVGITDDLTNIFDYSLNQLAIIDNNKNKEYSIMNKYIYSNDNSITNYIYDMFGNELYCTKAHILAVSKNGFALIKKNKDSKIIYEIVNIFTSDVLKKYKFDNANIDNDFVSYSLYKDYFIVDNNDETLYDAKEDITYENYPTNKDYLDKENIMLENETFPYLDNNGKILSLKHNLYYENNKIYDEKKQELKALENVKYIYYYNNKIFIYSKDDICILDNNLNYLLKPTNISNTLLKEVTNYNDSLNNVMNFNNIGIYNINIIFTDKNIYLIKKTDSENVFQLYVINNKNLKMKNKYRINVENKDNIKITNSGIVVTDVNNNNTLYSENGKIKLKRGKIKIYSDDIITINSKGNNYIYNLRKERKLVTK